MSSISASGASVINFTYSGEKSTPLEKGVNTSTSPVLNESQQNLDVSKERIEQAIEVMNNALSLEQRTLNFTIDDISGRSVIKVIDYKTDEVIKQIPTEELLKVAQDLQKLQEDMMGQSIGLLIDNKV